MMPQARRAMSLHHLRIGISLALSVPEALLAKRSPIDADALALRLAEAAQGCRRQEGLSYFPAIDYFRGREDFDQDLIRMLDDLTWLAGQIVREEIRRRLRGIFSNVRIESVQSVAFALPSVRPSQADCLSHLAKHYHPARLRLDLQLGLVQKRADVEGMARYARQVLTRWLKDDFPDLKITHAERYA